MAACTAAPNPAIPATFSVPARRPSSWPPPRMRWLEAEQALCQHQRAGPLGTADLVRGKRYQIGIQYLDIDRNFSKRLDRVDVQ